MKRTFAYAMLPAALAATTLFPAQAQHLSDDNWLTIRYGGAYLESNTDLRVFASSGIFTLQADQELDLGSAEWAPRLDITWKLTDRQRLIFDHFTWDKSGRYVTDRDIGLGLDWAVNPEWRELAEEYGINWPTEIDGIDPADYTIPAGSSLDGDIRFRVSSLVYDFALANYENYQLGAQVGVEWADIQATANANLGENIYQGQLRHFSTNGWAPVVGLRFTATPTDRWIFSVQTQYMNTSWGGDFLDSEDGNVIHANAFAEYRFTPNLGVYVGYDWFKLDLDLLNEFGDGVHFGFEQEFHGPVAGMSFSF